MIILYSGMPVVTRSQSKLLASANSNVSVIQDKVDNWKKQVNKYKDMSNRMIRLEVAQMNCSRIALELRNVFNQAKHAITANDKMVLANKIFIFIRGFVRHKYKTGWASVDQVNKFKKTVLDKIDEFMDIYITDSRNIYDSNLFHKLVG